MLVGRGREDGDEGKGARSRDERETRKRAISDGVSERRAVELGVRTLKSHNSFGLSPATHGAGRRANRPAERQDAVTSSGASSSRPLARRQKLAGWAVLSPFSSEEKKALEKWKASRTRRRELLREHPWALD